MLKLIFICLMALAPLGSCYASANTADAMNQASTDVMKQFNKDVTVAPQRAISTKRKHQVLFLMGAALLVLVLFAAGFGVAMGIFGKDVFIWHVLSAGLATTLAVAHAVVAFVWFYPGH